MHGSKNYLSKFIYTDISNMVIMLINNKLLKCYFSLSYVLLQCIYYNCIQLLI